MKPKTKTITVLQRDFKQVKIDLRFPVILYKKKLASEYLLFKDEYNCTSVQIFTDPVKIVIEHLSDTSVGQYIGEGWNYRDRLSNKARLLTDLDDIAEAVILMKNNIENI